MGPDTVQPPDAEKPARLLHGDAAIVELLEGIRWHFYGPSAIQRFFRKKWARPGTGAADEDGPSPTRMKRYHFIATRSDIVELARRFEDLKYGGPMSADAYLVYGDDTLIFVCDRDVNIPEGFDAFRETDPMDFYFDAHTRKWLDPRNHIACVKMKDWEPAKKTDGSYVSFSPQGICGLSIFISQFLSGVDPKRIADLDENIWSSCDRSTALATFSMVVQGEFAAKGLELLRCSGFIRAFLPELLPMDATNHSKEEHPEGNVWTHSLATLEYRKYRELPLSLALLLHDCGKPLARPNAGKLFDGHAEIGADLAGKLLARLGYDAALIEEVQWLVKNHMIPQALSELPLSRTEPLMERVWFPELLELHRCDLVSTYRGPDAYYEACKKYRAWLRTHKNPYLALDRKRQIRKFVDS